jgi:glycosyltransferase involved in cell wall biosynthesis
VFNRYLLPGGEETSVARIAEDIEAGGHSLARFWRASEEWRRPGAPPRWRQPLLMRNNSSVLAELEELHRAHRSDVWVLHNVLPVVSMGVYGLARRLRVPVIQWLHNYRPISLGGALFAGASALEPEDRLKRVKEAMAGSWNGRLLSWWLLACYRSLERSGDYDAVGAWVPVSDQMRDVFRRAGWDASRLHTVRHSWHLSGPAPASQEDHGYFLYLGRMIDAKGVRFLIRLWEDPALRGLRLKMAGQGPLLDELRSRAPATVEWLGHVEGAAKQRLLRGCRAVVFPCLWTEPLSTVAYEAYEHAKPILASDIGGMREIIADNVTGRLLPRGEQAPWAQAITALDAAEARRLGQAGRRWIETHATPAEWNRLFTQICQHLRRAAGPRSPRG